MTSCPRCGSPVVAAPQGDHCTACGYQPGTEADGFIRRYVRSLWRVLTEPNAFFREMPLSGGIAEPLAFALITHWIGSGIGFLWASSGGATMAQVFEHFVRYSHRYTEQWSPIGGPALNWPQAGNKVISWFWGTGAVLMDPFTTLLMIVVTTFFIWIGARLLVTPGKNGAPKEITYESALRINCYGLAPAILAGLPFVGGIVSLIYMWVVTIIGAKNAYKIGVTRATFVALFTHVVFSAILLIGAILLMFTIFRVLSSASA